jgi:acetolactate synthase I/II/III large subunit
MRVHTALGRALAEHGVTAVFGVQGDANLLFVDDLVHDDRVRYVSASHESGAVLMADGHSRATGRLGVATVTCGPGVTNTVTALTEAARNRTPMLVVAGDTPTGRRGHIQDIDQRSVIFPTGAGFHEVRPNQLALEDLSIAVQRAYREQRPVVLNVPQDLHSETVDEGFEIQPKPHVPVLGPDAESLDTALGILAASRHPILLAGRGAVRSGARPALIGLAKRLGAPLATTLLAKDYFHGEPLNIGILGTLSSPISSEIIGKADCVAAFGASLNDMTTLRGTILAGKGIIQCDSDASRIGYWGPSDAGVTGDVRLVAEEMSRWLDELDRQPSESWASDLLAQLRSSPPEEGFQDLSTDTTVDPRTFTSRLGPMLPDGWVLVTDGGRCMKAPWTYLQVKHPTDFMFALNFGSIGLAMAIAIGAGIGHRQRPVVAAMGDGGFMLGGLAEFNTAVRHGVDLISIVYNDGCYGSEHTMLKGEGRDVGSTMLHWPDLAPVAQALGGVAVTVRNLNDMEAVDTAIQSPERPLLIDVKISPEVSAHLRPA